MVGIIVALAVLAMAGSAIHLFWPTITKTGPRRWGWIQSWSKGWKEEKRHRDERIKSVQFEAQEASDKQRKIQELSKYMKSGQIRYDPNINTAEIQGYRWVQARELYNDGWRCGGGIDQSGRRILFRGESTAYVTLEVWTEVERLTKAKWDELHGKPLPKFPLGTDFSPERPAVVGEKGKETIRGFAFHYGDQGNGDVIMPGAFGDSIKKYKEGKETIVRDGIVMNWDEIFKQNTRLENIGRERTQVTEVNEVPETFTHMSDASRYVAYGLSFDVGEGKTVLIKYRNAKKRFLPSVNPLGDTGAFMRTIYYDPIFPPMWLKYADRVSFRHKKGGRRG